VRGWARHRTARQALELVRMFPAMALMAYLLQFALVTH
jgi:hypothetical protein